MKGRLQIKRNRPVKLNSKTEELLLGKNPVSRPAEPMMVSPKSVITTLKEGRRRYSHARHT